MEGTAARLIRDRKDDPKTARLWISTTGQTNTYHSSSWQEPLSCISRQFAVYLAEA